MRSHEQSDAWRRVASGEWKHEIRLQFLRLSSVSGFADTQMQLNAGITLFCGVNASGKTRLIRSIASSLRDGGEISSHVELGLSDKKISAVNYIDIFHLSQAQLRSFFLIDRDLSSRVDQAGDSKLKPKELRMLSWLVGKDYQEASIAELDSTLDEPQETGLSVDDGSALFADLVEGLKEDPDAPRALQSSSFEFRPEVTPYFTLKYNDQTFFGSESLSRGELAAMNLLWALKSIDQGSLAIFFDEPDLFLSTEASSRALVMIAEFANQRKSPVIVATHSIYGLARAPGAYRVLLMPSIFLGSTSLTTGSDAQMWRALRVAAPTNLVLAVEDEAGRQWTNLFASRLNLGDRWAFEIWNCGDASKVRAVAGFPDISEATTRFFVGVLDGDERDKPSKNLISLLYLPTRLTPEQFILDMLKNRPELAEVLGISFDRIIEALSLFEGDNPHDRVPSVASDLGLDVRQFRGQIWNWYFFYGWGRYRVGRMERIL